MFKEFELRHGSVLCRLALDSPRGIKIFSLKEISSSAYLINKITPIYLKYSQSRMPPWQFSFNPSHYLEIKTLENKYPTVILGLICGSDGVVGLTLPEFYECAGDNINNQVSISANRKKREMYLVKGSKAQLDLKIGQNDFTSKVLAAHNTTILI